MRLRKHAWFGLVLAVVLVGVLVAVAGCGGDEGTDVTAPGGEKPVAGGTINFYINEPAFIDPVNLQESEGTQVGNALFDSLVAFDYKTGALIPAAAESWEPNEDASVWTFHLKDAKFHNGRTVTAADFKYAWDRLCNPVNESEVSYHLAPVKGFAACQDGSATELAGVKVIDDKTLEVTLEYSFGDFEYVVGHPALAPIPKEEVEKDPAAFADMPIGNGPFKMAEAWAHDQYIKVVAFDDYYGTKANVDGVDFKIFKDEETAFLEFKAGNLDFTTIPSGQEAAVKAEYGESADGLTVSPGQQSLFGAETAIYFILLNNTMPPLDNPDVRAALSLAINRQAICDVVYQGARKPATGICPEGLFGYLPDQWAYSKYDVEQAKQMLEKAGYPGGEGLPDIVLSFNSGSGHEDVMALVQADLKAIGINSTFDGQEWAQYLDKLDEKSYMVGRLGWIADYPIMDNFLYPLFETSSGDNYCGYSDPAIDQALLDARATLDVDERVAKYQEIERTIGEAAPMIPINTYKHHHIGSDRVRNLIYSSQGLANLEAAWIAAAE